MQLLSLGTSWRGRVAARAGLMRTACSWWMALVAVLAGWAGLLCATPAHAGVMNRELMEKAFPSPLIVGEKDRDLPVWPILKQDATSTPVIAYVFESIDLAPIPGFSGTPYNLLVAITTKGEFMDVRVLSQHEPVFLDGLGEGPMHRFVDQYKGLSLKQNIKIGSNLNSGGKAGSANVYIDGVAKATASVRILNQSLLAASLKVARAKMGYAEGRDPDLVAHLRPDVFESMGWDEMVKAGLITRKTFRNRDVEAAFKGTVGEGLDEQGTRHGDDSFVDVYFAYLNVPSVGRNLLTPAGWKFMQSRLEEGDHALLLVASGRYSMLGEDFVRGAVPDRLTLQQQNLPLEIRDLDLDVDLKLPPSLRAAEWRAFRVIAPAGLDPAQALNFNLHVTRSKGQIYPERVTKTLGFDAQLPAKYFEAASSNDKTWRTSWRTRVGEVALLAIGLGVLAWALRNQLWLSQNSRRLAFFRTGYLLFTVAFIGWYAQGQLSIVNITALVQAVMAGRNLDFFLYDPMTVSLWAFVAITFFVWGRGTFCGWLCPFGALQELVSKVVKPLRLPQWRISERADAQLKKIKYAVLAAIVVTACVSVPWTDRLVEVEPFKTSITLVFARDWPFVAWAGGLLALSAFVYKGYCRYLCPLGAGMAIFGRLRRFDWIARRTECGTPCQRCRNDCAYKAIPKSGGINYNECFQCLDCVAIFQSEQLCVPLIAMNRKAARQIPIAAAVEKETVAPVQG
ncbi:4Fe-4S binding protein [Azohydromonas lata]|uniref:4Fe-4S binding protein n=1 Tax=Azohydromonas lata TaxID=45677 RepID=A0ABU5IHD0_9BURK|nr:4Fe-4S binding protein [Azohydromonas lata]MDZ5458348.1 4Fe-4S binding protein [Azohydromonas lata]